MQIYICNFICLNIFFLLNQSNINQSTHDGTGLIFLGSLEEWCSVIVIRKQLWRNSNQIWIISNILMGHGTFYQLYVYIKTVSYAMHQIGRGSELFVWVIFFFFQWKDKFHSIHACNFRFICNFMPSPSDLGWWFAFWIFHISRAQMKWRIFGSWLVLSKIYGKKSNSGK